MTTQYLNLMPINGMTIHDNYQCKQVIGILPTVDLDCLKFFAITNDGNKVELTNSTYLQKDFSENNLKSELSSLSVNLYEIKNSLAQIATEFHRKIIIAQ